ncbi:kinase domain protein [Ancylostoma ceylanicum]|uniref:Kinase domain protein n=1 Tax=Ancylostoma ceylanicum TaxID=53326 RepID=A0A0D6LVB8_9BILA|nr:kinase domain protein [Ancylostoma ceylanicum]
MENEEYLYLVLEFFPKTLHQVIKAFAQTGHVLDLFTVKRKKNKTFTHDQIRRTMYHVTYSMPILCQMYFWKMLYMFQLFRGLAFMSSLNICHRDIKPHNLLVNPEKGTLRICDFGSAKVMNKDDTNVSYICSRYYRAPELIFGAVSYTTKIDVWSAGTVMAELLLGKPLFPGESAVDQLVEIMKVLGSPTKEEIFAMNQNYKEFKFPNVKRIPWEKLFKGKSLQSAVSMLSTVLRYDPSARSYAIETLAHPFFDELRNPDLEEMPNGKLMPRIFDWLEREVNIRPDLNRKIFPRNKSGSSNEETKTQKSSNDSSA